MYVGFYEGVVIANGDPEQLCRVRVEVHELRIQTGWVPVFSDAAGAAERGRTEVLPEGAAVAVGFFGGSPDRPFVVGARRSKVQGVPETHGLARGAREPRAAALKGIGRVTLPLGLGELTEPADPYAAQYPHNRVEKGGGSLSERDDTPGRERIHEAHVSGTNIEVHPDGTVVIRIAARRDKAGEPILGAGQMMQFIEGSHTTQVGGNKNEHVLVSRRALVEGDDVAEVLGDSALKVDGDIDVEVGGEFNLIVKRLATIAAAIEVSLSAPRVNLGRGVGQAGVVTTLTHPFDYFTGNPIVGSTSVKADK